MIKVTNLNKFFNKNKSNEIHVINNTSLEFPENGLVTILGESGSGKTTLMNVIGGLDDFESGALQIDEYVVKNYSSKTLDRIRNEKIGYIFQNYLLLQQRTVYDNLKIVLNMYNINETEKNERIDYVLEAVGMLKYKKKNVSELSGGQQQRIAIARALIKSPSVILADEPTGNLDEKNTISVMNIIKKISENTLVILVSHEKSIATSYSDYIIEVSDGKVIKQSNVKSSSLYQYEDDQNLYLKEYKYKNLSNDYINIDFYSNEELPINLQVVYENSKFYIKSTNDVILLDDTSEVQLVDDFKKEVDTSLEVLANEYDLKPLKFEKVPSLSFSEKINLALSNLTKMKKRTAILAFPLIIIMILTLLSIQTVASASIIDYQSITNTDSRIYNITLEKGASQMNTAVTKFGFDKFYDDFVKNNPNIEPVLDYTTTLSFTLPSFTQLGVKKYNFSKYSLMPLDVITEDDLLYGRMPNNASEIVVEKWVIENAIKDSTLGNFMNVGSFLNKQITCKDTDKLTIVGIADTNQNSIYLSNWQLFNIYPSVIKKNGTSVCSISELNRYLDEDIDITLNKNECIINITSRFTYLESGYNLNDDTSLHVDVVDLRSIEECPFAFIVSDEMYSIILKSVLKSNYDTFNVYCETEEEIKQVQEYLASIEEYFASGELLANTENGFPENEPADYRKVELVISHKSNYNEQLQPYINESIKVVTSRILITVTIVIISIVIVFFSMKSYAIKNIYDIGVYRAIGIKKGSVVFVYALEILLISLQTTLIGGVLCYVVTNIIASVPTISTNLAISLPLFLISTFGMIILNVLIGMLPVILCMKNTPSQLLTKYDV